MGRRVTLAPKALHVELHGNSRILEALCPFCTSGRFVVLPDEERWFCYGCGFGGTGAPGRRKFLEMLIAGTRTRRLGPDDFTLENSGLT